MTRAGLTINEQVEIATEVLRRDLIHPWGVIHAGATARRIVIALLRAQEAVDADA